MNTNKTESIRFFLERNQGKRREADPLLLLHRQPQRQRYNWRPRL